MKKKITIIISLAIIIALAVAGTALAGNGNETGTPLAAADGAGYSRSAEKGSGQQFAIKADQYETEEEFHTAVLVEKLAIIELKVADSSLTREDADAMIEYLTSCDGTCETEGENPDRPEDGWGIFGTGGQGGNQELKGSGNRGTGVNATDCDEDGTPLEDGSGSENGQGYKGGRSN